MLIERLGIADQLKPRMKVVPAPVAAAVAKGEVDLGIHQIAELMPVSGIDIVGALPADLQTTIIYRPASPPPPRPAMPRGPS